MFSVGERVRISHLFDEENWKIEAVDVEVTISKIKIWNDAPLGTALWTEEYGDAFTTAPEWIVGGAIPLTLENE